jgi:hypothetical protein
MAKLRGSILNRAGRVFLVQSTVFVTFKNVPDAESMVASAGTIPAVFRKEEFS